jgi:hypothetical protein
MLYIAGTVMLGSLIAINILVFACFDGYISLGSALVLGFIVLLCGLKASSVIDTYE